MWDVMINNKNRGFPTTAFSGLQYVFCILEMLFIENLGPFLPELTLIDQLVLFDTQALISSVRLALEMSDD